MNRVPWQGCPRVNCRLVLCLDHFLPEDCLFFWRHFWCLMRWHPHWLCWVPHSWTRVLFSMVRNPFYNCTTREDIDTQLWTVRCFRSLQCSFFKCVSDGLIGLLFWKQLATITLLPAVWLINGTEASSHVSKTRKLLFPFPLTAQDLVWRSLCLCSVYHFHSSPCWWLFPKLDCENRTWKWSQRLGVCKKGVRCQDVFEESPHRVILHQPVLRHGQIVCNVKFIHRGKWHQFWPIQLCQKSPEAPWVATKWSPTAPKIKRKKLMQSHHTHILICCWDVRQGASKSVSIHR